MQFKTFVLLRKNVPLPQLHKDQYQHSRCTLSRTIFSLYLPQTIVNAVKHFTGVSYPQLCLWPSFNLSRVIMLKSKDLSASYLNLYIEHVCFNPSLKQQLKIKSSQIVVPTTQISLLMQVQQDRSLSPNFSKKNPITKYHLGPRNPTLIISHIRLQVI